MGDPPEQRGPYELPAAGEFMTLWHGFDNLADRLQDELGYVLLDDDWVGGLISETNASGWYCFQVEIFRWERFFNEASREFEHHVTAELHFEGDLENDKIATFNHITAEVLVVIPKEGNISVKVIDVNAEYLE